MTFDTDGYPTNATLRQIEKFDLGRNLENLPKYLDFVLSHWVYPDCGIKYDEKAKCLSLSTIGWSGNESLIYSMKKTPMFWILFWDMSSRGGHYRFELFQFDDKGMKCDPQWKWEP